MKPKEKGQDGSNGKNEPEAPSAKADGTEGKAGTQKSENTTGRVSVAKVNDGPQQLQHKYTNEEIKSKGVLGVMNMYQDKFAAVASSADFTNGLDERSLRGGYIGSEPGEVKGWGTGVDGDGAGGGGWNTQTIGPAKYGTYSHGDKTGTGYKVGGAPGEPGGRKPKDPLKWSTGQVEVKEIDPNILRQYIHKKKDQLSYCYQKELTVKPSLSGTVTAKFTIDANGKVIVSSASGMDDNVDQCVSDIISTIEFPAFGSIVNVTRYPFIYHPAGGA
jgi:hypothetical protein